jgi:3-phytase
LQTTWKRKHQLAIILLGALLSVLSGQLMANSGKGVTASVETDPVPGRDDAADDPAVWVHPIQPELSTVIGTDKGTPGLAVYGLDGRQIQFVKMTGINNVDLRHDFPLGDKRVALVVASNPVDKTLETFWVDPSSRQLQPLTVQKNESGIEALGVCMYHSIKTGRYFAFSIGRGGEVQQWEITTAGESIRLSRVRSFSLDGKSEACAADDGISAFYVSEEERGIWRFGAEPDSARDGRLIDSTDRRSGHLRADVEGLAVYDAGQDEGYLIASSQGNDRYVVYDRSTNKYIGNFEIQSGRVDGVSNTDGIEVTSHALGPAFSKGLFVAQDGRNLEAYVLRKRQNFKLVQWEAIANHFEPSLKIHVKVSN